jgi:energy-coupling factor transporter ATP-binding protein EcfA2
MNLSIPKKSKDLIGHFKFINDFKNYMTSEQQTDNKIILCIGPSGIGKTTLLKIIFEELKFTYKELIDFGDYVEFIDNYLNYKSINSYFTQINKLLFIDDLEIYINNDRNLNNYLINLNNINKIPIICVVNKQYERKIADIKKKSKVFYLNKPSIMQTTQLIIDNFTQRDIEITKEKLDNIKKLIKIYKNNVKLVLLNLDNIIMNKEINENCYFDDKFNDSGLFDIVNDIFNKRYNIIELSNIIYGDSNLITMLLHENLITEISSRRKINNDNIINIYDDILDDICFGDFIEQFVYSNNEWNLLNILYVLKNLKLNNKVNDFEIKKNDIKNNFTQILTKYSIKCNFNKKKNNMFESLNIDNRVFDNIIQNILYVLDNIDISNKKEIEKIIDQYNINKDIFDIINKYNKEFEFIENKKINKIKKLIK